MERGEVLRSVVVLEAMTIELVTTDGIFELDGGEWDVTNNIWLVGDDREVIVIDAAHDHHPIVDALAGRRVAPSCSPTATTTTSTRPSRCTTPSTRRSGCTPPTTCCGTSCTPTRPRTATSTTGELVAVGGHELGVLHTPGHSPGGCASTTPTPGRVLRRHAVLRRSRRHRPQLQRRADDPRSIRDLAAGAAAETSCTPATASRRRSAPSASECSSERPSWDSDRPPEWRHDVHEVAPPTDRGD